jgi:hypothetical protein
VENRSAAKVRHSLAGVPDDVHDQRATHLLSPMVGNTRASRAAGAGPPAAAAFARESELDWMSRHPHFVAARSDIRGAGGGRWAISAQINARADISPKRKIRRTVMFHHTVVSGQLNAPAPYHFVLRARALKRCAAGIPTPSRIFRANSPSRQH